MRIDWLAAALSPRDVAPHPNFMSEESSSDAALLALLAQLRLWDYRRLHDEWADALEKANATHIRLLSEVHKTLDAEHQTEGLEELQVLLRSGSIDPAVAMAGTLFAAVGYSESDRHSEAVDLLEFVLQSVATPRNGDEILVRAAGLQQLALRRSEMGYSSREAVEEVLDVLAGLRATDLTKFPTSKGVRWRSSTTCSQIIDELKAVADAHLVGLERDLRSREWTRIVKAPAPRLDLLARRSGGAGLAAFLKEAYEAETRSTSTTFASSDPVESGVYEALMHYELIGSGPLARTWRSHLGQLRIIRRQGAEEWSSQEGIRLLRRAEDLKSLDLALSRARAGGPLRALQADARQILRSRVQPLRLGRAELKVVDAAAHLLTSTEAEAALDAVLNAVTQDLHQERGWSTPSVHAEAAWDAAVALAGPAEQVDRVALRLLEAVQSAGSADALLTRALGRAAASVEWDGVTDDTRARWAEWLKSHAATTIAGLADVVGPRVGVPAESIPESESSIERAASLLNRHFRTGEPLTRKQLGAAPSAVIERLKGIRSSAAKGTSSWGSISAPDVAGALVLYAGVDELWTPLVDLLLDRSVARQDKESVLDRLASADQSLPGEVLRRLGDGVEDLLTSPRLDPLGGQALTPFPAALRLAAAYSLLSDDRVLAEVARLGGSFGTEGRIEAARTLALLTRLGQNADWIVALALQLSHDAESLVRAETGRALAALARKSRRHAGLVDQRLLELLGEDGLVVPLLVLRGLQREGESGELPSAVLRRIAQMADTHLAWGVRLQARALLEDQQRRPD